MIDAPLEAAELVPMIAEAAYEAGSGRVHCLYEDPALLRLALTRLLPDALAAAPSAAPGGLARALSAGAARLSLWGPDPELLHGVDPERVASAHAAAHAASRPEREYLARRLTNASAVPVVTASWARAVRPGHEQQEAMAALWDDLARALLLDASDSVRAWRVRLERVAHLRERLMAARLRALRARDGDTQIEIALQADAPWGGGTSHTADSRPYVPILPAGALSKPTGAPGAHGTVHVDRTVVLAGQRIEGARLVFERGVLVELDAASGTDTLERLLDWRSVPMGVGSISIPIACESTGSGLLNPVLDRQSALGMTLCARVRSPDTPSAAIAIDLALGSATTELDGVLPDGRIIAVMRDGVLVL